MDGFLVEIARRPHTLGLATFPELPKLHEALSCNKGLVMKRAVCLFEVIVQTIATGPFSHSVRSKQPNCPSGTVTEVWKKVEKSLVPYNGAICSQKENLWLLKPCFWLDSQTPRGGGNYNYLGQVYSFVNRRIILIILKEDLLGSDHSSDGYMGGVIAQAEQIFIYFQGNEVFGTWYRASYGKRCTLHRKCLF